jgi:hypothetical protein
VVPDWDIINTISSVDIAHSYSKFTLGNSILFYRENSSSPMRSNNEPQNNRFVCRDMTQQEQKKKERIKQTNKRRKKENKKTSTW